MDTPIHRSGTLYEVLVDVVLAIVANYPGLSGAEVWALKTKLLQIIANGDGMERDSTEIVHLFQEIMNGPHQAGNLTG